MIREEVVKSLRSASYRVKHAAVSGGKNVLFGRSAVSLKRFIVLIRGSLEKMHLAQALSTRAGKIKRKQRWPSLLMHRNLKIESLKLVPSSQR